MTRLVSPLALALLAVALLAATGAAARAQDVSEAGEATEAGDAVEASEPTERRRVAVLLLGTGSLDPATADALSEALIGAVAARGGVIVIGQGEVVSQLGQDLPAMVDCVASTPCLGRLAVQLGLAETIAGTLAQRDGGWVFNLQRTDVATGALVGRVHRELEGDLGAVADALSAAVPELYAPIPEPTPPPPPEPTPPPAPPTATLVVASRPGAEVSLDGAVIGLVGATPLREEGILPGRHEVAVGLRTTLPWARTVRLAPGATLRLEATLEDAIEESVHPLVFVGGALATAALAAAIPLGVSSQDDLALAPSQRFAGAVSRAEALAYYGAREGEAIAADVLFALAGAAVVTAVIALFFPERRLVDLRARAGR